MKMNEILSETSAASVATVVAPMGMMQKRNPDGTVKNGLDAPSLIGKPAKKKKATNKKA
jgi:hypothetical protein